MTHVATEPPRLRFLWLLSGYVRVRSVRFDVLR